MSEFHDPLAGELAALMEAGVDAVLEDRGFDDLARRIFAAQYESSAALRAYWDRRACTPERVRHWTEVIAVPAAAFKETEILASAAPIERVFHTSGTTAAKSGRHALSAEALALYRTSMLPTFRHFVLPELEAAEAGARTALRPIVLQPPAAELPHSSLAFMIDGVVRAYCSEPPVHVMSTSGLALDALRAALAGAERDGRPVLLLGTALALVGAAEELHRRGERYFLPSGSRAMETGGGKGREREMAPEFVRERIAHAFGLADAHVVSEYGMTEACSQFYDRTLLEVHEAEGRGCEWAAEEDVSRARTKHGPPWVRAVVCDPETLAPLPPGREGVLRWVDLANRFSVSFLQTEDVAVANEEGRHGSGTAPFELRGRAQGAAARGCSLAAEEWMRVAGHR